MIRCVGEIDVFTGPILDEAVRAACFSAGDVVIEMGAVSFMDSTGLGIWSLEQACGAAAPAWHAVPLHRSS